MIASMTAFGRTEHECEIGRVMWEIKTVNHRYLEISLRLPEELRMLEASIREHIAGKITRGKVDCALRYEAALSGNNSLEVNTELVNVLLDTVDNIAGRLPGGGNINALDVLRWPGVIKRETPDPEVVGGPILEQLDRTLATVVEMRQREGEKLHSIILERCQHAKSIVHSIKEQIPVILAGLREKLTEKARELQVELDTDRLEQEVLLLAQKHDVAEEMDRLASHINETERLLDSNKPVGRRLDFLMQELNREANTLGSKSVHYNCTNASVELKVLIEQMREQIQNIE